MDFKPKVEQLEGRDLLSYTIADLGTLGGGRVATPHGINSRGDVVGESEIGGAFQALGGNHMTGLPDVLPNPGVAWGTNDAGEISGCCYQTPNGQYLAFLYDPDNLVALIATGVSTGPLPWTVPSILELSRLKPPSLSIQPIP
jgi:hypothetical protein